MGQGHDVPRISPAFLEEERRAIGDRWFSQEYLCGFVETEDSVFLASLMESAGPGTPGQVASLLRQAGSWRP